MKSHLFAVAAGLAFVAGPSIALDVAGYRAIVGETVMAINAGDVDVAHLVGLQEQLIAMGVAGAEEYAADAPDHAELMRFVAKSAPAMTELTLEEIEPAWHEGEAFAEVGIDVHDLDHFGPAVSHMDAIIHPATAVIALRAYAASGDEDHLDQVIDELSEVVEHLSYIE